MDCAYKNDGGAKASLSVDNCLNLNDHVSIKNSVSIFPALVNSDSNNSFQSECNGNKSNCSGFLMDKQIELSNNITNGISIPKIDINQKVTQDLSLLQELEERTLTQNCVDVEQQSQKCSGHSSLDLNDAVERKELSSDGKKSAKDGIHSVPSSNELVEIRKCTDMSSDNQKSCTIFETNLEEIKIIKDSIFAEIEHEPVSKVIEENHSESEVNTQSMSTPFFSDNNECMSEEEEVYSEVEEIVDSDHYLDVASDSEENEDSIEERKLEIDNECQKMIDSLIKNVESETTELKLEVVDDAAPTLPSNTIDPLEACDELMSEEEVYEEILEDSDEESVLNKQNVEVNDEAESAADVEMPNGLQLKDCTVDVKDADDSIISEPSEELESKISELKESVSEVDKIESIREKVSDVRVESEAPVTLESEAPVSLESKAVKLESEAIVNLESEAIVNLENEANVHLESELLIVEEEEDEDICGEHIDATSEGNVPVDITEKSESNQITIPNSNVEKTAFNSFEKVNVKEAGKEISETLQSNSSGENMDVSEEVKSPEYVVEKSGEKTSPSLNPEGTVTEEMNVETIEKATDSHTINDSMDISSEVLASVEATEESKVKATEESKDKVTRPCLNVEGAALDVSEKVKENEKDIEDNITDKKTVEESKAIKEEVKDTELSDEFDTYVEDFYVSNESLSNDVDMEPPKSDSEDELELLIEDFNAANSDDDCLIVEDTSKVIVIKDDIKKGSNKQKNDKLNFTETSTNSVSKFSSVEVPERKDSTSVDVKLNSSEIDANVKLKDPIVKSVSNTAYLNSEKISDVDKKQITVSDYVNANSTSNEKDSIQTGNKLSSNYGLFPKICEKFTSYTGNTQENVEAIVNEVLTNLITTFSPCSVDNTTKLKEVCGQKQGKKHSELSKGACQVADTLPVMVEKFDEKSGVSYKDEKGVQFREDNHQEDESDEIIVDTLGPLKMESKSVSNSTDSSAEILTKEESRKRAFDKIEDNTTDVGTKKFKDSFSSDIPSDLHPDVQEAVKDEVFKLIPQENSFKFITSKKILDTIVMDILAKSIQDIQPSKHDLCKEYVDEAEKMLQILDEECQLLNAQAADLMSTQEATFQKKKFNPQVQTRTVGVNVKIFRVSTSQESQVRKLKDGQESQSPEIESEECDLPPAMLSKQREQLNKLASPLPFAVKSSPPRPNNPSSTVSRPPLVPIQQSTQVRRILAPSIVTNASIRPRQAISGQRLTSASPNVTIAGNPLATLNNVVTNRPFTPRPATVPSRIQTPINKSTIDLTGEGAMNKRTVASSIAPAPTTTVSNLSGQQNVLVPISNFLQMLPNNKGITQLSTGNQVQAARHPVAQPARQTILQPVRPGMLPSTFRPNLGARTVAYFMPSNSNQLPNFGGRGGIAIPPFLSGSNPRGVQTIVVRMTTAAPMSPLSSIVNSSSRMPAPSQSALNTTTATTATSHGLVLFPRQVKHPAPYPPNPTYPLNSSFKVLPPKPSLKGSRAPEQGIILSWNMNLQSAHADIANYQLFAYQESSGLVSSALWKKVGDVKALPLPMACTLTQFIEGHRYYFGVRAVDTHNRCGPYSDPVSIMYSKQDTSPSSKK